MALELLERGVDPSPLTKASWTIVRDEWSRRYNRGETAIDVVRKHILELRKYKGEPVLVASQSNLFGHGDSATEEPRGATEFLSQFSKGT